MTVLGPVELALLLTTPSTPLGAQICACSGCIAGSAFTGIERKAGEGIPQRARAPPRGEGEASTST